MLKNLRETYKTYKNGKDNLASIEDYLLINGLYNQFLMEKVLEGEEITLPSRMGTVFIQGRKSLPRFDEVGNIQGLAPDWVKTKALWDKNPEAKAAKKLLYHTNEHSDGIRYKIVWSKAKVLVSNKTLYALRFTRTNKRAVMDAIKQGKEFITL